MYHLCPGLGVFLYWGSQHKVPYISLFVRMRRDHRASMFFNNNSVHSCLLTYWLNNPVVNKGLQQNIQTQISKGNKEDTWKQTFTKKQKIYLIIH
jgi:hypothetical protein